MAASSAPRLTDAGSKLRASGGAIGSSEGRHAAATNPTATANKRTATAPTVLRRAICAHPQRVDIRAIDAEPTFGWRDSSCTTDPTVLVRHHFLICGRLVGAGRGAHSKADSATTLRVKIA